jgi:predicted nuclease of predicted toxin-antitoxin system
VTAVPLRDLGLRDATDREIFLAARREGATVVSKDADFVRLLEDLGPPPQIIWNYVRQYFNAHLKQILSSRLPSVLEFLQIGEDIVEVS